jgi:hypothetical protein
MTDDLIERLRRTAAQLHANGMTSAEIYRRTKEQETNGFAVSAPYTSLLASCVKDLEHKAERSSDGCK